MATFDGELIPYPLTKQILSTTVGGAVVLGASGNDENHLVGACTCPVIVDANQPPNTLAFYFPRLNPDFGLQPVRPLPFKMGHGVPNAVFTPDNLIVNACS